MLTRAFSHHRLTLMTLGLAYIALGMLGALPAVSPIQLVRNTHVSLEMAGTMFTVSSIGGMLGIVGSGFLVRSIKPKYLLLLGLLFLGSGSLMIALTREFPVLLLGGMAVGLAFGFIDISLNTIATLAFGEQLASNLAIIHGIFSLGALLGPAVPYHEVTNAVERLVAAYLDLRTNPGELFIDAVQRLGVEPFRERIYATH